jgi:hypothetical protein
MEIAKSGENWEIQSPWTEKNYLTSALKCDTIYEMFSQF